MHHTLCRYLHEVCSPSVVHKNFTSSNILLDSELNPHLSDCGLASLIPDEDQVGDLMISILDTLQSVFIGAIFHSLDHFLVMTHASCIQSSVQ